MEKLHCALEPRVFFPFPNHRRRPRHRERRSKWIGRSRHERMGLSCSCFSICTSVRQGASLETCSFYQKRKSSNEVACLRQWQDRTRQARWIGILLALKQCQGHSWWQRDEVDDGQTILSVVKFLGVILDAFLYILTSFDGTTSMFARDKHPLVLHPCCDCCCYFQHPFLLSPLVSAILFSLMFVVVTAICMYMWSH